MAPLPPESTDRYKVSYASCGNTHVMDIRSTASPATLGSEVDAFLTALGNSIRSTTLLDFQFAASGSTFFNPVTTGFEGNIYGTVVGVLEEGAQYYNFVGRSTGGRRVRLAVFGAASMWSDYRAQPGDDAGIDAAVAFLQGSGNNWLAIDGLAPIWKSYANAGVNAHWQKAIRT